MNKQNNAHRHTSSPTHSHDSHTAHEHNHHEHNHNHHESGIRRFIAPSLSFLLLLIGMVLKHLHVIFFADNIVQLIWYIIAFLPVGLPVIKEAIEEIKNGDIFNEFTLMVIACIGAFAIREYPEAVGVMLFYSIGETLQHGAVEKATNNISSMLDLKSREATIIRDGKRIIVNPDTVKPGELIEVKPGERVPLDGVLLNKEALFDTSPLTGESIPRTITQGNEVLAGMISSQSTVEIKVTKTFSDTALAKILHLVKDATKRKARPELFIRKFARIYTPVVIILASLLVLVPWIVSLANPGFHFIFSDWLYRSLVFLVISCPCALVISVPLGYFAGIGAASKAGILFKGGNYLEAVTGINTIAFDKTGTLTTGSFSVVKTVGYTVSDSELLCLIASAEANSTHPLAKAVVEYANKNGMNIIQPSSMHEIAGYGTVAQVGSETIIAGNKKLLLEKGIEIPVKLDDEIGSVIVCAVNDKFAGYLLLSDTIKKDAHPAVNSLRELGVSKILMLSGDKKEIVKDYGARIGVDEAIGELLPQEKASFIEHLASDSDGRIAFVGDGMNDAPVISISDIGIAMGGLGSDAAIESADIVIKNDDPLKVATAIKIGRTTHSIVKENIIGAILIKVAILGLGAAGYASLWAAVFADVGVALLAVLNSMRILWKKY